MEDLTESSYLPPPPIPPLWMVVQNSAVKFTKLSGLLAQLVRALSKEIKGHGFNYPGTLFHFPIYLYVLVCILCMVRRNKLSGPLAQLVRASSKEIKGHEFNPPRILFQCICMYTVQFWKVGGRGWESTTVK